MNELLVFLQSLPEAFKTGFIYSIMVMGVYLTYKILDFPDMSVDGTFPLGGFVFAAFALSKNGFFGIKDFNCNSKNIRSNERSKENSKRFEIP